jgi:hypothetical protein
MLLSMENVETQNSPRDSAPYDYFCVAIVTRKYSGLLRVGVGGCQEGKRSNLSWQSQKRRQMRPCSRLPSHAPEFVGGLIIKLPTFRATEIESCSPQS